MASDLEENICGNLRYILHPLADGEEIPDSKALGDLLISLECYLPDFIEKDGNYIKYRELDGLYLAKAYRKSHLEVEITGMAILITSQKLFPFWLQMKISESHDKMEWLNFKLGMKIHGEVEDVLPGSREYNYLMYQADMREIDVDWAFKLSWSLESMK